jgi:hypothetical protein
VHIEDALAEAPRSTLKMHKKDAHRRCTRKMHIEDALSNECS